MTPPAGPWSWERIARDRQSTRSRAYPQIEKAARPTGPEQGLTEAAQIEAGTWRSTHPARPRPWVAKMVGDELRGMFRLGAIQEQAQMAGARHGQARDGQVRDAQAQSAPLRY